MATSSRDARRRRIVDRGSDRLALISGRIQTLPSSSSSPESHHSHTASCPPLIAHEFQTHVSDQSPVPPHAEGKPTSSLLPKHDSGIDSGQFNASGGGSRAQPLLRECETSTEALRAPGWKADGRVQSSLVSSTGQNSSISASDREHHFQPQSHYRKFFTPNQISSAIAASESTRIYCSLAVAILVVLSYVGFPVLGSHIIKSIIILRPLYLVLLTSVSIVLARLLLEKQGGSERAEQEANSSPSIGSNGLEQAGKALEMGLVLQNIMGAVFMDCSVYAIVVICGLSLAQKLGC